MSTPIRRHFRRPSSDSDTSDTSTTTVGIRVAYTHIARHTPLPPDTDSDTDTHSVGSDRVASEYFEEVDQPIWYWTEEFHLEDLFEEPDDTEISDDEMDMRIPTFSGITSSESVVTFLENFDLYCASKSLNAASRAGLITAAIIGPAKTAALAVSGDGGGHAINTHDDATTLTTTRAWLLGNYHTEDIQQGYKDQLNSIFQGTKESPNAFYTRVRHLVDLAGYAVAVKDQVAENAWISGLHSEIRVMIRATPIALTLAQKVGYGQHYWTAHNPGEGMPPQQLGPRRPWENNIYEPAIPPGTTSVPAPAVTPVPKPALKKKDDGMEELTRMMSEMTAHIADLQAQVKQQDRFNSRPQRSVYTAQDSRSGSSSCYLCGKPGHFARDCRTRSWREGREREENPRQNRESQANLVEEIVDSDYEEEAYPVEAARTRPMARRTPYPGRKPPPRETPEVVVEVPKRPTARQQQTETNWEAAYNRSLTPEASEEPVDVSMMEREKIPPKPKKIKEYQWDPWKDLKDQRPNITYEQLFEIAPSIKAQMK